MNILVINAGSSSLKYQLIEMNNNKVLAKGIVERIGMDASVLTHKPEGKEKFVEESIITNHKEAMRIVIKALISKEHGVISSMDEISAVGHRVLHAAEKYTDSVIINDEVIDAIRDCIKFGPLHNPANIMGIEACLEIMPDTKMVAVFDTAFHQTMPKYAYLYGLPYEAYSKYGIRRYGFHGTSHKYVAYRYAEAAGRDIKKIKIITCHLGNGSSITAVNKGKCVDTSMGLTPLAGVVMGTRCGDIDPAIVPYMMTSMNMDAKEVDTYMNKKSGVFGLSGVSSDFRDLWKAAEGGNERAKFALDVFCYTVRKYIGAYAAAMGGVDAIVFTAGIGENDNEVRNMCVEGLGCFGAYIDKNINAFDSRGKEMRLSSKDSKVDIWCVPTNEELAIAKETYALCK